MDTDDEFELMRRALLEFAMACRLERDRLAQARLEIVDRRLEEDTDDALLAKHLAERVIDGCR
ncbi:MAG TPA: hypothetical protein VHM00_01925 [Caldimonas sp.]|jgi:hypothetical protein|nr:hypothetical protein [Caldimonas sp.]HEX2539818.1 hypothetical protein [Caldimonas sp.]